MIPHQTCTVLRSHHRCHDLFCNFAARVFTWQTPVQQLVRALGRSFPTAMHWAPVHNKQSGEWRAEWACLRCNTSVDELLSAIPGKPVCALHGPRASTLDFREQSRGWVCCRGSPAEILPCTPLRFPLIEDREPVDRTAPAQLGESQAGHPKLGDRATSSAAWFQQRPPPPEAALPATNSWFFVPLLHAAARRLHQEAQLCWEACPRFMATRPARATACWPC